MQLKDPRAGLAFSGLLAACMVLCCGAPALVFLLPAVALLSGLVLPGAVAVSLAIVALGAELWCRRRRSCAASGCSCHPAQNP
jgi:hypothetical protein